MGFYQVQENGGFLLHIRATPKAQRDEVAGLVDLPSGQAALSVRVRALPDKGAANKAVVTTVAKALSLPKSDFEIIAGETSREKTLRLKTQKAPTEDVRQRLENLIPPKG